MSDENVLSPSSCLIDVKNSFQHKDQSCVYGTRRRRGNIQINKNPAENRPEAAATAEPRPVGPDDPVFVGVDVTLVKNKI